MKAQIKKIPVALATVSLLTTTGCFFSKKEDAQLSPPASPKEALIQSLDSHLTHLVSGVNEVVIKGAFVQTLAKNNPPKPIPLESEADVRKGLDYLLSNPSQNGSVVTYTPDSRLCSELIAKNDPANCQKVFGEVRLVQTIASDNSGTLEVKLGQAAPIRMSYGPGAIDAQVDLSELRNAALKLNEIVQPAGDEGISNLPSVMQGILHAQVASQDENNVSVTMDIQSAILIQGQSDGYPMQVAIPAAQQMAKLTLSKNMSLASVSIALPMAEAYFYVKDSQMQYHPVAIHFPGATGSMELNNPAKALALKALQLVGGEASFDVDGVRAARAVLGEITGEILAGDTGGVIHAIQQFNATLEVTNSPVAIDRTGTFSLTIDAGTKVEAPEGYNHVKITNGGIHLQGTGDLNGTFNAQPVSCFQKNDDVAIQFEAVTCQF